MLRETEVAPRTGAGKAPVVLDDLAAALGAGVLEVRGVCNRHGLRAVALCGIHDVRGHVADFAHERIARERAPLDERQLVLPLARQLGVGQSADPEAVNQAEELLCLRGRNEFPAFALHVVLVDEVLNDCRTGCRRAKALFRHCVSQLRVVYKLARAFHR